MLLVTMDVQQPRKYQYLLKSHLLATVGVLIENFTLLRTIGRRLFSVMRVDLDSIRTEEYGFGEDRMNAIAQGARYRVMVKAKH
jgi:hypothetical protein